MSHDECVKVVVRCRPMDKKEITRGSANIIEMDGELAQVRLRNPKTAATKAFTFDYVFNTDTQQADVFEETARSLVDSVLEGYNGTMFAYGQTGCGKTFTMQGESQPPELLGVVPRSFNAIFRAIDETQESAQTQFLVSVAYIEIYNEEIRDLLGPDQTARLALKEDPDRGVYIRGLQWQVITGVAAMIKLMNKGNSARTTGATLMNATSSRSHSIFMVNVERNDVDDSGEAHIRVGKLNLVDLAGSERQSKTHAEGMRLKEATKINLSLSALGNVISALVAKSPHIPYRDSKLTRLLQDSLGGNTKTVMIAAISPADYNYEETLSTLRYANRAKNITNKVRINEDPKDALLRQYQEEIQRLMALLEGRGICVSSGGAGRARRTKRVMVRNPDGTEEEREVEVDADEPSPLARRLQFGANGAVSMTDDAGVVSGLAAKFAAAQEEQKRLAEQKERHEEKARELAYQIELERQQRSTLSKERESLATQLTEEQRERERIANALSQRMQEERANHMRAAQALAGQMDDERKKNEVLRQEMEQRRQEEDEAKADLMQRLASLQSKLMAGKGQATTDAQKHEEEMRAAAERIRKAKKKQLRLKREKLAEEEEKLMMEEKYASQQEELERSRAKIAKLQSRLRDAHDDADESQAEFAEERQRLLEEIRAGVKDARLYEAMVDAVLTPSDRAALASGAAWDEDNEKWIMPDVSMHMVRPEIGPPVRRKVKKKQNKYGGTTVEDSTHGWRLAPTDEDAAAAYSDDGTSGGFSAASMSKYDRKKELVGPASIGATPSSSSRGGSASMSQRDIEMKYGGGAGSANGSRHGSGSIVRKPAVHPAGSSPAQAVDMTQMQLPPRRAPFQPAGALASPAVDKQRIAEQAAAAVLSMDAPARPAFRPAFHKLAPEPTDGGLVGGMPAAIAAAADAPKRAMFAPNRAALQPKGAAATASDATLDLLNSLPASRAPFRPGMPQPPSAPAGGGAATTFNGRARRMKEQE